MLGWLAGQWHHYAAQRFSVDGDAKARSSIPPTVAVRPDRIADPARLSNATVNQWFNPDAFRIVSCTEHGSPGSLQAPATRVLAFWKVPSAGSWIFRMFKNFTFTERFKVQFRAVMFLNFFEHASILAPQSEPQYGRRIPASSLRFGIAQLSVASEHRPRTRRDYFDAEPHAACPVWVEASLLAQRRTASPKGPPSFVFGGPFAFTEY
jgi:hypothetical protein